MLVFQGGEAGRVVSGGNGRGKRWGGSWAAILADNGPSRAGSHADHAPPAAAQVQERSLAPVNDADGVAPALVARQALIADQAQFLVNAQHQTVAGSPNVHRQPSSVCGVRCARGGVGCWLAVVSLQLSVIRVISGRAWLEFGAGSLESGRQSIIF